jgi:hypothetical protein
MEVGLDQLESLVDHMRVPQPQFQILYENRYRTTTQVEHNKILVVI